MFVMHSLMLAGILKLTCLDPTNKYAVLDSCCVRCSRSFHRRACMCCCRVKTPVPLRQRHTLKAVLRDAATAATAARLSERFTQGFIFLIHLIDSGLNKQQDVKILENIL